MKISDLSNSLSTDADGIFVSEASRAVSYAAEGHAECFLVEDASFWFRHRNDCIAHMIANHQFCGQMLDIGGGNGFVAQRLASEGHSIILLEPGIVGARNARLRRGLNNVVCSTVDDAEFKPNSMGAIGLFDVIEHIDDDREFVRKISPLLTPGGRLYMTVPCHQWLWSQADVDAGHFRRHTSATLQCLLADYFTIDYFSYFFQSLLVPQLIFRAMPYRLGLSRHALSTDTEHGGKSGIGLEVINVLLENEAARISRGERLAYGASCLIAATVRNPLIS